MERKIILLHENPKEIKKSKSAMWYRYEELLKDGRLVTVKKWFSDANIDDIMPYL
jgi:hypothetical protein